jgi:hypothetical protein
MLEEFDDNVTVGQVIKRIYDCDLFGETLQVFHILEITDVNKNIDYEMVYNYKGGRLSFEANGVGFQNIDGDDAYHSFYEEDLRKMKVISREEFDEYNWIYNDILRRLTDLIKS